MSCKNLIKREGTRIVIVMAAWWHAPSFNLPPPLASAGREGYCVRIFHPFVFKRSLSNGVYRLMTIVGAVIVVPILSLSNHCYSCENRAPVDENYRYPILKPSNSDLTEIWKTRIVIPITATRVTYPIEWGSPRQLFWNVHSCIRQHRLLLTF